MIDVTIKHSEALGFSVAAYELFCCPHQHKSSAPLTKALGAVSPNSLDSWLKGAGMPEEIGDRHNCGFFVYIALTSSADDRAFANLHFATAFKHINCGKISRPDKAIISTSLKAGYLDLHGALGRPIFRLTEKGKNPTSIGCTMYCCATSHN